MRSNNERSLNSVKGVCCDVTPTETSLAMRSVSVLTSSGGLYTETGDVIFPSLSRSIVPTINQHSSFQLLWNIIPYSVSSHKPYHFPNSRNLGVYDDTPLRSPPERETMP